MPSPDTMLDLDILSNLEADVGREVLPDLIGVFLATADARLDAIKEKSATGDLDGAAAEAHALKSSSATFGAMEMRRLATDVEAAGKTGDGDGVAALIEELEAVLGAVRRLLEDHATETTGG